MVSFLGFVLKARHPLKDDTRYDQGPGIHGEPRRVSLPVSEAQAGWMPKSIGKWSLGVGRRHPVTMRKRYSRHCQ